jgi:hypothetical protein
LLQTSGTLAVFVNDGMNSVPVNLPAITCAVP